MSSRRMCAALCTEFLLVLLRLTNLNSFTSARRYLISTNLQVCDALGQACEDTGGVLKLYGPSTRTVLQGLVAHFSNCMVHHLVPTSCSCLSGQGVSWLKYRKRGCHSVAPSFTRFNSSGPFFWGCRNVVYIERSAGCEWVTWQNRQSCREH
jgi:hypothetical protein